MGSEEEVVVVDGVLEVSILDELPRWDGVVSDDEDAVLDGGALVEGAGELERGDEV